MAIGAGRSSVLRMVLRQGLVLTLIGLAAGLAASMGAGPMLDAIFASGMAGDGRTKVVAVASVALLVLFVALVAAYIPARRASMINPTDALRID
jgi:ABC-type antimicrobial peptide transport system permease subunit